MDKPSRLAAYLATAEVLKPQGVAGELKCRPLTDDADRYFALDAVYLKEPDGLFVRRRFKAVRVQNGFLYARLEGVADRDAAEALRGCLFYVARADAAPLPEGGWYIADIIGCRVIACDGSPVGTLTDVQKTGANDVYTVEGDAHTYLFPALKATLLDVDVARGVVRIDADALVEADGGAR